MLKNEYKCPNININAQNLELMTKNEHLCPTFEHFFHTWYKKKDSRVFHTFVIFFAITVIWIDLPKEFLPNRNRDADHSYNFLNILP